MSTQFNMTIESNLKEYMDETQAYIDTLKDSLVKKITTNISQPKLNIFKYNKIKQAITGELMIVND